MLTSNHIIIPKVQEIFTIRWMRHFIETARLTAKLSKDRSTKCGCALVGMRRNLLSSGDNGMPRGMNDNIESRHERPAKYAYFEHGERNAIFNAAYEGVSLKECVAFITGPPCVDCTRAMIQSGIIAVIIPEYHDFREQEKLNRWRESFKISLEMMAECNIHFEIIKDS